MVQNYNQQPPRQQPESSGIGVVLGILLVVVIAVGAYFFIQNRNGDRTGLEPAAGNTAMEAPDTSAIPADNSADETSPSGTTVPAPQQ
jgi:hypothetical protein